MWELWKRRNARRNGKEVTYGELYQQCQNNVFQLTKTLFPWINVPKSWEGLVEVLKRYRPKLHYHVVSWNNPPMGWVKCNTDGASRGNPGESSYSFCIRNNEGDLLYAEAQNIGQGTSMEAEIRGILCALKYCKHNNIYNVVVETDSLSLTKMIQREWKVP